MGLLDRPRGARRGEPVSHDCIAALVRESDNPYDPNAVMVQVDARQVAHLSREDAIAYRRALQAAAEGSLAIACKARISGRGSDADTPNLGIFLKLPDPTEAELEVRTFL